MPKNRPATGDAGWGVTLNAHLNQLMPNGGGINFGTTRPALTASDDGYTMIDTSTREVIRWTGTAWVILMGGADKGKQLLTAPLNLYVNTTGNDNNIGTQASPFATIQRAVNELLKYDLNFQEVNITVQGNSGYYDGAVLWSYPNANTIKISGLGNVTTSTTSAKVKPANFGSTGGGACFQVMGNNYDINNIHLQSPDTPINNRSYYGVWTLAPVRVTLRSISFGTFPQINSTNGVFSQHLALDDAGTASMLGNQFYITGGAGYHAVVGSKSRLVYTADGVNKNYTITNNPNFAGAFISGYLYSSIEIANPIPTSPGPIVTFNGSATGIRYAVSQYSTITTGTDTGSGPNQNFLPGNAGGQISSGGLYL